MPYETLYRRYRPKRFEEVVGQAHVVKALMNAIKLGRISHAYLFAGQRGTGKTTVARLLAKALNCAEGPTPEPCCVCDACKAIDSGGSMDVIELDAASHTKVEQIRELIVSKVAFMPAEMRYRVFIIDEAHMLSLSSFNALLKTLEEPPPHVVFVLATTDPHKIPPTIHSRCQRFDFRPIQPDLIAKRLSEILKLERDKGSVSADVTQDALMLIAKAASGSLRDALSMLEQLLLIGEGKVDAETVRTLLGMVSENMLAEIMSSIADGDVASCWRLVQEAVNEGKDLFQLVKDLMAFARELLACKIAEESAQGTETQDDGRGIRALCQRFSQQQLIGIVECLREVEKEMRMSEDLQLTLDIGLLRAICEARTEIGIRTEVELARDDIAQVPTETVSEAFEPAKEVMVSPANDDATKVKDETEDAGNNPSEEEHELKTLWGKVLERIKSEKFTTYALLQGSELTSICGNRLIVSVAHPFHKDCLEEPAVRRFVENVASSVLSMDCSISFVSCDEAKGVTAIAKHIGEATGMREAKLPFNTANESTPSVSEPKQTEKKQQEDSGDKLDRTITLLLRILDQPEAVENT
ncbi:MAG: hypothetical protein RUDDFDWM_001635 [Candidatus Fervidibacterota bacterium]